MAEPINPTDLRREVLKTARLSTTGGDPTFDNLTTHSLVAAFNRLMPHMALAPRTDMSEQTEHQHVWTTDFGGGFLCRICRKRTTTPDPAADVAQTAQEEADT